MPTAFTYPGVYVEEVPSGVRPITGVSTSDTAFVGFLATGPLGTPTKVTSATEAERVFGPPVPTSEAALQLAAYFANGGSVAWVVRIASATTAAPLTAASKAFDKLTVTAASAGTWGNSIRVTIDHAVTPPAGESDASYFNLVLKSSAATTTGTEFTETYRNITLDPGKPRYAVDLVNNESRLAKIARTGTARPPATAAGAGTADTDLAGGANGALPNEAAWKAGITALDAVNPEVFNLLCLAGASEVAGSGSPLLSVAQYKAVVDAAAQYCAAHRAFLIVDPPSDVDTDAQMTAYRGNTTTYPVTSANAAIYFPRITVPDPLTGLPREIGPCGSVAGAIGRTDAARGIWKAPAGTDVPIGGTLLTSLDDLRSGALNVAGVNVIRSFPVFGTVIWGARTMQGADQAASEWKYVPIRRLALHVEESLYRGLQWVVFEPNDEGLWSSIRLNVGSFMNGLFRQGAFAGTTTRDAYFVRCDKDTTTQADVDRGVVNILVGFKPLEPAEFVVLKIQQIAGQAGS